MSIYGYIFGDSGTKDHGAQHYAILSFATNHRLPQVHFISESSAKSTSRPVLSGMVDTLLREDVLIVEDFSKLGESITAIVRILFALSRRGVKLYVVNSGFRLDDNTQAQVVASASALVLQIEQEVCRVANITAGVDEAPEGKPKSDSLPSRTRRSRLDGKEDEIRSLLSADLSLTEVAGKLGVSRPALTDFIRTRGVSI